MSLKSGITDFFSHNCPKVKIDCYDCLPIRKKTELA